MTITGKDLMAWGMTPGPIFKDALLLAAELEAEGVDLDAIRVEVLKLVPPAPAVLERRETGQFSIALDPTTDEDRDNLAKVQEHMEHLMRTPVIEHGAVMPDACPAGSAPGTIPVGGAIASRGIHPGAHSSDTCCSLHVSLYADSDPVAFMDVVQEATHFGPGGRATDLRIPDPIADELDERNPFLTGLADRGRSDLGTQGDGNHFAYLGRLEVTMGLLETLVAAGQGDLASRLRPHASVLALVTHHGSRSLGAVVYKRGIKKAVEHTQRVSPDTPPHQAWLDPETVEGDAYWRALEYVRRWTKRNHEVIHERVAARLDVTEVAAFGNEHNFIWRRGDLFHHGKGATPAWRDADGHRQLGVIPLNMAEPILLVLGGDNEAYGSWAPHGAGRNKSRTQLLRDQGLAGLKSEAYLARSRELLSAQTEGLDVRFFFDRPDVSETPVAYKPAATVRAQIDRFGLAEVIAEITPLGCLMAGDYDRPWLNKKRPRPAL